MGMYLVKPALVMAVGGIPVRQLRVNSATEGAIVALGI